MNAKVDHYQQRPKKSRMPATLAAFSQLQTQQQAAQNELNHRLRETREAAALRAQHDQPDTCCQQCPHVLRSDLKVWP